MVTDLLQEHMFRELAPNDTETPFEFEEIKAKFQEAMEKGQRVLLETNELNLAYSVVLTITYVGNRWCRGEVHYHQLDKEVFTPYTIHYSDIYTANNPRSTSKATKIIFEGENPYGTEFGKGV